MGDRVRDPPVAAANDRTNRGTSMTFAITVDGAAQLPIRHRLIELVGGDAVSEQGGQLVVSAPDQAAMLGLLYRLDDLGLGIARVERTRP